MNKLNLILISALIFIALSISVSAGDNDSRNWGNYTSFDNGTITINGNTNVTDEDSMSDHGWDYDSAVGTYEGTLTGVIPAPDTPSFEFQAIGSDSRPKIVDQNLDPTNSSVEAWYYPISDAGKFGRLQCGAGFEVQIGFRITASSVNWTVRDGGAYVDSGGPMEFLNWSRLKITRFPSEIVYFVMNQSGNEAVIYNDTSPAAGLNLSTCQLYLAGDIVRMASYKAYNGSDRPQEEPPPPPPPAGDLSINLISPEDDELVKELTQDFIFNYTITNESVATNCEAWTNETGIWSFEENLTTGLTPNATLNISHAFGSEGIFIWNVACNVSGFNSTFASSNFTLTIDTTNPVLYTDLEGNNSITIFPFNFTASINVSDTNLYSLLINDSSGVIVNITNINDTIFNYSLNLNISSGYNIGKQIITITIADGHTDKYIDHWNNYKNALTKEITFDFSDKWYEDEFLKIRPESPGLFDRFETYKRTDRYIYKYKSISKIYSKSFIVTSSDYIDIIKKDKYKAWLVNPNLLKWTDFNIVNATGEEKYKVERINDKQVRVIISKIDGRKEIIFESSGNLNVVTENFEWYLVNVTDTFPTNNIEKVLVNYTLNISKTLSSISSNATFYYNGTEYLPTKIIGSTEDYYYVSLNHTEAINYETNISINWTYNITSGLDIYNGSIIRNQTIYRIVVGDCYEDNYVNTTAINFTVLDESDDSAITDFDFDALLRIWDERNTYFVRNYSFSNDSLSTYNEICIHPSFAEFKTDITTIFTNASYNTRNYIVNGGYLNSTIQNINIYMTPTGSTTTITITTVDENDDELTGYTIEAWRYNLGTDDYTLIDTQISDSQGQVNFALDISNNDYKFIVKNPEGIVVYTEAKQKIIQTSYTFRIILGTTQELITIKVANLDINLNKNRANKTFILYWNDISPTASKIIFKVLNQTLNTSQVIHAENSTLSSGSLGYVLPISTTNVSATFIANVLVVSGDDGEIYFVDSKSLDFREEWEIFGEDALLMAMIFILTMMFIGLATDGEAAIVLSIFGMIIFVAMGFVMLSVSGVIAFAVSLIIYLIKLNRDQQ